MARRYFSNSNNVFHITNRTHNKEWFSIPLEEVWEIFSDYLKFVRHAYDLRIYAFILMANHFHLLASAPDFNLSGAMLYFMRETSKTLNRATGTINQVWGDRFHRCEITSDHYFNCAYKYIYRNASAINLVKNVEDYRFSSLHGLLGRSQLYIPIEEDINLFANIDSHLEWLNTSPKIENSESIRRALKRKKFALPQVDSRPNPLEHMLY